MVGLILLGVFILLMFLNIPVSISMAAAIAISLTLMGVPGIVLPQMMVAGIESWVFLAIPFFILAAQIMNFGGISERLFKFANEVVGWMKGGLAHANVLASMIFAGISGAAVADASGLGLIEMKIMNEAGYEKPFSVGVTLSSCMLGPIIPPSIMLILYGHFAGVSIAGLWFAGIIPGIIIGLILMAFIYISVSRGKVVCPTPIKFSFRQASKGFIENFFVILLPILLLWSLLSGLATPTETGIIACMYTFILSLIFRGKAFLADIPKILISTAKSSGLIMFITAMAAPLAWIITKEKTAVLLAEMLFSLTTNKILVLLIINLFLLIIGALMDCIPALLILIPLLVPLAEQMAVNPLQFGLMVVFNLLIGIVTPPMGFGLFIMAAITDVPMKDIIVGSLRFFLPLIIGLLLITFVPIISTFLPTLLGY